MTGQADGTVYINSKLDTSGFKPGSKEIEAACRRAANSVKGMGDAARIALEKQVNAFIKQNQMYAQQEQKVEALKKKLEEMSGQKVATSAYAKLEKEISRLESALEKARDKKEKFLAGGEDTDSKAFWNIRYDIEQIQDKLLDAIEKKKELEASGSAYQDVDTSAIEQKLVNEKERLLQMNNSLNLSYDVLRSKVEQYGGSIQTLANRHGILRNTFSSVCDTVKKGASIIGETAKKAFNSLGNTLKKVNSYINSFAKKVKELAHNHLPFLRKEAERTKSTFSGFADRLKSLSLSLLIFDQLRKIFSSSTKAIREGFENLYNENEKFRYSIESLKSSLATLKNALAAAFAPIAEIAIPYIQRLVEWLTEAVNLIGQFIAALTGRKTYTRAIRQSASASEAAADASKDAAEAIEDETAAVNKQLGSLDKLNNLTSQNNKNKTGNSADSGIGSGSVGGTMFEEVPIESSILDAAEKIKDILSKLFEPLKKAWEQEGQFVIDAWKYALEEVWKLIKDIGRDFLTVWNEDETVAILANILHIIGDIGLVVGNLARNFREAWNENEVGLNILRNIRDVIGIIVQHIRNAADATAEWADELDFYPILDAFNRFLISIKPVVDAVWGILEDFYTHVLLPLAKWSVEKGLPELLQVFFDFNNKVDWESLRKNIAEFWDHLEPFAETVGEGLILFIRRVSDALADFLNSQEFKDFLKTVEDWMDSVTPEDVADALEMIAKGLIALKLALLGFSAIGAITGVLTTIKTFLSFFGVSGGIGEIITSIAGALKGLAAAISGYILPALAVVAAAVAGWKIGEWINEKLLGVDTPSFTEMMEGIKSSFTDGSWKEALKLWGDDIYNAFVTLGERQDEAIQRMKEKIAEFGEYIKEDWNNAYIGQMIASFKDGSWKEALQLWGEDIKADVKSVGEFIKEDWNNAYIGQMISSFTDGSWKEALKLWKDDILDAFDTLGEKMSKKWDEIWEGIKSLAEDAFDWISKKWSSISGGIGSFGSKVGGLFKNYSISVPNIQAPVVSVPTIATANIPYLASGAVIPPNAPFAAILGDQKNGKNLELPENLLRKIVREESGNDNGDINLNLTVECEGYQLLNIMQKLDRQFYKQNGRHAFT